jgi:hypothetical protein
MIGVSCIATLLGFLNIVTVDVIYISAVYHVPR